jgi:hypothetical protein
MARALPRVFASLALVFAAACSGPKGGAASGGASDDGRLTIFLTTELKGQIEPCGCTTDPLGDIARWANLVAEARRGGAAVLYMDGGSTLFEQPSITEAKQAQERMTADVLVAALQDPLGAVAVGLGPNDLADGTAAIRIPRMAANVPADAGVPLAPPRVVEAGGVKVGVFGVVAPAAVTSFGVAAGDPAEAAREAVAALRKDGARVVIGLLHMERVGARALVRDVPGIDFALIGQNVPDPVLGKRPPVAPDRVGQTWLIEPGPKGQVVSRLDVTMRPGDGMADALGEGRIAPLEADLAELATNLEAWRSAPDADPAFVAGKDKELAELRARIAALRSRPVQAPDKGSYFTLTQLEIDKALPCSPSLVATKQALDEAIGQANLAAAGDRKPPEPGKGQAGFAGIEECESCHATEVEMWKGTRHAAAWQTLEKLGKQYDLGCVSCHVTGWDRPGGSNLAFNEPLRDVQCEVCHGPASLHVDSMGKRLDTLTRSPSADLCAGTCHTPEHSDTFALEPYLRDVVGVGHGAARREALGDGPTGRQLRAAGLDKAGRAIGKGCAK